MTAQFTALKHPPPRLSMDDYYDFIEASLRDISPERAARQKSLEEIIETPFRIGRSSFTTGSRVSGYS